MHTYNIHSHRNESKHPTDLFLDHKPITFPFTQKSNPNHRIYRFQLISSWIKNNPQQKPQKQKLYRTDLFSLIEKENSIDNINLSGPPDTDSKYTINQIFNNP